MDGMDGDATKYTLIVDAARVLFEQRADWVTFFREVFGADGVIRRELQTDSAISLFGLSPERAELSRMLAQLREAAAVADESGEPTHVITVRMPASMHAALKDEAHRVRTSLNQLCITKLLQPELRTESGESRARKEPTHQ